jgi:hypothetical protein
MKRISLFIAGLLVALSFGAIAVTSAGFRRVLHFKLRL